MQQSRSPLDSIFLLPPSEKRLSFSNKAVMFFSALKFQDPNKNDSYIYYLASRAAMIMCLIIAIPYIFAYVTHTDVVVGSFVVPGTGTVHSLLEHYYNICFVALVFGLFPFYLLKFFWNVDISKYDVLWSHPKVKDSKSIIGSVFKLLLLLIIFVLALRYAHIAVKGIPLKILYGENLASYSIYILFYAYVSGLVAQALLIFTVLICGSVARIRGE